MEGKEGEKERKKKGRVKKEKKEVCVSLLVGLLRVVYSQALSHY